MHEYIQRNSAETLQNYLKLFPAVAVLGPRQCGKSTLIKHLAKNWSHSVYLDLQNDNDLNKLSEPYLFFQLNEDSIICLDEIQLVPELGAKRYKSINKRSVLNRKVRARNPQLIISENRSNNTLLILFNLTY